MTWQDVRAEVQSANPKLAEAIDQLDPGDQYKLIKVRYPYGQCILDKGHLQLPHEDGGWYGLYDQDAPNKFRKMLSYGYTMPAGIVLHNSVELYLEFNDHVIPFSMMNIGKVFALWTNLEIAGSAHTGRVWSINSGARSLIMLPKISDTFSYKKLRAEFHLPTIAPKDLSDQWETFSALARSSQAPAWESELLFFTANWLENEKDEKWKLFRYFLMSCAWHETAYLRNEVIFDFAFSCALAEKNLKPNPYLADTVKHLYGIGSGNFPGFIVASDNSAAPIDFFQRAFNEIYDVRHIPTIVHPGYHSRTDALRPSYYSLQFPTLLTFSPKSRKASSKLDDLKEIKHIIDRVRDYFLTDKLSLKNSPLFQWASGVNYQYFHTEVTRHDNYITEPNNMIELDKVLQKEGKSFEEKSFCNTSPFVRGCIRVSCENENQKKQ